MTSDDRIPKPEDNILSEEDKIRIRKQMAIDSIKAKEKQEKKRKEAEETEQRKQRLATLAANRIEQTIEEKEAYWAKIKAEAASYSPHAPLSILPIQFDYETINARTCVLFLHRINTQRCYKMKIPVEAWLRQMKQLIDEYGPETVKAELIRLRDIENGKSRKDFVHINYLAQVLKNGNKTKS